MGVVETSGGSTAVAVRSPAGQRGSEAGLGRVPQAARRLALWFLGLACLRVWLQVCLYDAYIAADAGLVTIVSNAAYSATLLAGTLWALLCKPGTRHEAAMPWIAFATMTMTAGILFVVRAAGIDGLIVPASVLAGFVATFGGAVWACPFKRLDLGEATVAAFAALGLGSLAGFALSFLPVATRMGVAVLMPVCALLYHRAAEGRQARGDGKTADLRFDSEPAATPAVLLGGLALVSLALGVSRGLPSSSAIVLGAGMRALHQLGVVAVSAAIVALAVARGRCPRASVLWGLDIALIAAGILLTPMLPAGMGGLAVAITNLGDTLSLGIVWLLAQDYARHSSVHPYAVFGAAWFARIFVRDLGRMAAPALAGVSGVDIVAGIVVFVLAGAMAALLSGVVPHGHRLLEGDETPDVAANAANGPTNQPAPDARQNVPAVQQSLIEQRVALLQREYGLTEREAQVCALIASGRNKTAVAEYLVISENTVRTHSKSAYAKLGVHTKEELAELLEQA